MEVNENKVALVSGANTGVGIRWQKRLLIMVINLLFLQSISSCCSVIKAS